MKNFLFGIVIWSISTATLTAFAGTEEEPQTAEKSPAISILSQLTPITYGQYRVHSTKPSCPRSEVCRNVSILSLRLPLAGCLDHVHVTYKIDASGLIHVSDFETGLSHIRGQLRVFVSALNVANPQSATAICVSAPAAHVSIDLGTAVFTKENVEVVFVSDVPR